MKVKFKSDNVLNCLQAVSQVINKKNSLPILDCARFTIGDNKMYVTGSDTDSQLTVCTDIIESSESFTTCIQASQLTNILSKLGEKVVEFDINNNEIVARYEGGKFTMMCENADEYPNMDNLNTECHTSEVNNAQHIYNAINATICAMGDDMLRPVMAGVYFDYTQESLTTVATDGRILVKFIDNEVSGGLPIGFILPRKPANVLRNLLIKNEEKLTISYDDHSIKFACESFLFTCRMIDGRYPNYNSVIPKETKEVAYVDRKRLIDVISRMMVFTSTWEQIIMSFTSKKLKVSAQNIDFSMSSEEELPIAFEGGDIRISFKGSFLDTILRNIRTNDVQFNMIDSSRACVINPFTTDGGEDSTTMVSLIMPMMID